MSPGDVTCVRVGWQVVNAQLNFTTLKVFSISAGRRVPGFFEPKMYPVGIALSFPLHITLHQYVEQVEPNIKDVVCSALDALARQRTAHQRSRFVALAAMRLAPRPSTPSRSLAMLMPQQILMFDLCSRFSCAASS